MSCLGINVVFCCFFRKNCRRSPVFIKAVFSADLAELAHILKRIVNDEQNNQEQNHHQRRENISQRTLLSLLFELAIDLSDRRITLQSEDTATCLSLTFGIDFVAATIKISDFSH